MRCHAVNVAVVLAVVSAWCAGCGEPEAAVPAPPTEAGARQALEAALGAWQNGQPSSGLAEKKPAVNVSESDWTGGKKLQSYSILRNEVTGAGTQLFTVKLTFKDPRKEQTVQYYVHGQDPVNVMRDVDLAKSLRTN